MIQTHVENNNNRNIFVIKRDKTIQEFDSLKIVNAILGALSDTNLSSSSSSIQKEVDVEIIVNDVLEVIHSLNKEQIEIETIQNLIEISLMRHSYFDVARKFVLYRDERTKLREQKQKLLQKQSLDQLDKEFSINQLKVLTERYLLKDPVTGVLVESPSQLFKRVATLMGLSDLLYDEVIFDKDGSPYDWVKDYQDVTYDKYSKILDERFINQFHFERFENLYNQLNNEGKMKMAFSFFMDNYFVRLFDSKYAQKIEEYYNLMASCKFMPNTPTLMNAGTANGGLSACFTLDAEDNVDSYIRDTVGDAAAIYKMAGGVGINFSKFRPEGSSANGVPNAASGPISFMEMINTLTNVIKAGGKRRGANMGILDVSHPDIEKFITMKSTPGVLENFNVSVGIWEDYWKVLTSGNKEFQLFHKTHHEKDRKVNPDHIWDLIALSAWKSAEPGVIFFDNANKVNHMKNDLGVLCITNPCSEQHLYANSSCTLGSINISKFVSYNYEEDTQEFDWGQFTETIRLTTRFLDNVVSMNKYPTSKIAEMAQNERRIGLGIMGLADTLFALKIPYNSKEGFEFMGQICRTLTSVSIDESIELTKERGPAPYFKYETQGKDINKKRTTSSLSIPSHRSVHIYKYGIRNTWNTTIAPTGTIAMITGCSYGIEPEFALTYEKKVTIGSFFYSNKYFEQALKKEGLYSEDLLKKIAANGGSIQDIEEIPDSLKKVFVTAMDLHGLDHVMAQASCQQYIDNSISKTVNLAEDVTVDDIKNIYLFAHEAGCKGITVYRDNSRNTQVLHTNSEKTGKQQRPSDYTLEYIQNNIKNEYVKEKLSSLFPISTINPPIAFSEELNLEPFEKDLSVPSTIINYEFKLGNTIVAESIKPQLRIRNGDICECGTTLIFQEGCKLCPTCQMSFCNV